MKILFTYVLSVLFSVVTIAQTGSMIYESPAIYESNGLELYEYENSYLLLNNKAEAIFVDKSTLEVTNSIYLRPYVPVRGGHSIITKDTSFLMAIESPYVGVVEYDFDGNQIDSFLYENEFEPWEDVLGGGLWRDLNNNYVFSVDIISYGNEIIFLNEELEETDRKDVNVQNTGRPENLSFIFGLSVTSYFEQLDSNSYVLGQNMIQEIICNGHECIAEGPVLLRELTFEGDTLWSYHTDEVEGRSRPTEQYEVGRIDDGSSFINNGNITGPYPPLHDWYPRLSFVDSEGNERWQMELPEVCRDEYYAQGIAIDELDNALVLIAVGEEESGLFRELYNGEYSILYKVDTSGQVLWQRCIPDQFLDAELSEYDFAHLKDIKLDSEGYIVLTGYLKNEGEPKKLWLIRLNDEGCLDGTCNNWNCLNSTRDFSKERYLSLDVFPNPTSINITIKLDNSGEENRTGQIQLYDILGQEITSMSAIRLPYTLEVTDLPHGQYLIKWIGDDGQQGRSWFLKN
ncbi:MAG: T9SS type A sorting domain-containing protein [Bacteroidota bacterium]